MVKRTSTVKFDVSDVDSAGNLTIRDVLGNRSDTAGTGTVMGLVKRVDTRQGVPTVDLADNNIISEVLGNKNDTKDGTSVVALVKNNGQIPATDSATNTLVRDVVGSKDDTTSGTSIVALAKQIVEDTGTTIPSTITTIDAFHDVPTADSADNVVMSDVIGNKTDTTAGDSLIGLNKQVKERTELPSQNTANNNVFTDVIGNKTDTDDGDSIYSMCTGISTIDTALMAGKSAGTFSYLDAGGEQTIVEYTPAADTGTVIRGIWLDLVNMTQNGTIKIYYKIDGSNYREVESFSFTVATDSDGFLMDRVFGIQSDFKVTYTEGADEGAARSLPFEIIYQISDGAWG
jgi:hypothetical protein